MTNRVVAAVAAVAVMLGAAGIAYGITGHTAAASQARQLAQLRSSQAALSARLGGILPKLTGTTRDLITCADLQTLGWSLAGSDSAGGAISGIAGPAPVSLPPHCINR